MEIHKREFDDSNLILENDNFVNTLLNIKLFNNEYKGKNFKSDNYKECWANKGIELIIRPECNQKCEYCYITQRGKKLYPIEERIDKEEILSNIKKLLDYLLYDRKCYVGIWELFAGDLFFDDLYFDIVDIFYNYFEYINNNIPYLLKERKAEIITPSNFQALLSNNDRIAKLEEYIEKFEKINVVLGFSWSTDGKYNVDTREKKELSDEYWEKGFQLVNKYNFGIHSMISFENIDNAIQNYDWFISMYENFISNKNIWCPNFLEVRNPDEDGWTDENIQKYLYFLEHIIQHRLKKYNNDLNNFTRSIRGIPLEDGTPTAICNDLISFSFREQYEISPTCTQEYLITIAVNKLNFVPCHRLTYPQFEGAKFNLDEEGKITGISAGLNPSLFAYILNRNIMFEPGCVDCDNKYSCYHGCMGAQYEWSGDIFTPIPKVCRLLKAKTAYLTKRYHDLGVIDLLLNNLQEFNLYDSERAKIIQYLKTQGYHYD